MTQGINLRTRPSLPFKKYSGTQNFINGDPRIKLKIVPVIRYEVSLPFTIYYLLLMDSKKL